MTFVFLRRFGRPLVDLALRSWALGGDPNPNTNPNPSPSPNPNPCPNPSPSPSPNPDQALRRLYDDLVAEHAVTPARLGTPTR